MSLTRSDIRWILLNHRKSQTWELYHMFILREALSHPSSGLISKPSCEVEKVNRFFLWNWAFICIRPQVSVILTHSAISEGSHLSSFQAEMTFHSFLETLPFFLDALFIPRPKLSWDPDPDGTVGHPLDVGHQPYKEAWDMQGNYFALLDRQPWKLRLPQGPVASLGTPGPGQTAAFPSPSQASFPLICTDTSPAAA